VGHLVAGALLTPSASPFLAVGNAAIDRTPTPVEDFAVTRFGTNDKLVLLLGMAVVLAVAGAAAGLVARRGPLPGLAVVAVLGIVGILAVLEQSGSAVGVLAPVAALLAGLRAPRCDRRLPGGRAGGVRTGARRGRHGDRRPGRRRAATTWLTFTVV
jgi:hypothetical protein